MSIRLFYFTLGFITCMATYGSGYQNVDKRFEKSLIAARSITNAEIEMVDTFWLKTPDEPDSLRTFHYFYTVSGNKYRTACKLVFSTNTNTPTLFESAFDGISYANFDTDSLYMILKKKSPSRDRGENPNNPLIAPFIFLSKNGDGCTECCLRFTDLTSPDFTNGLSVSKMEEAGGLLHLSVPGHPLEKQPTTWKITIQKEGETFTPKTISRLIIGAGVEIVYRLLNYTNLGTYQIPTSIEWTVSAYPATSPPTLISTGMVTVISAVIPDQLADSVFKLDDKVKSAAVVWDGDRQELIKSSPALARVRVRNLNRRKILLLISLSTTLVISIFIFKRVNSKN